MVVLTGHTKFQLGSLSFLIAHVQNIKNNRIMI